MNDAVRAVKAWNPMLFWNHCWYCGVELVRTGLEKNSPGKQHCRLFTRDHVVPIAAGGKRKGNTVAACEDCNTQKRDLSVEEYRIVFFGGHLGQFWGEQIARKLQDGSTLPTTISLCSSTGALDRYDRWAARDKLETWLRVNRGLPYIKPPDKDERTKARRAAG